MPDTQITHHQINDLHNHNKNKMINQQNMCTNTPNNTQINITNYTP